MSVAKIRTVGTRTKDFDQSIVRKAVYFVERRRDRDVDLGIARHLVLAACSKFLKL